MERDLDIKSQEYREEILEIEGLGDIDKYIGITKKTISNGIEMVFNYENFKEYFHNKFPNLDLILNYEDGEIDIYDKKSKLLIGHIGSGKISIPGFDTERHLYFEVDEKYSGKGIGKFLYYTYCILSENYKSFVIPELDYTSSPSMLNFYLKNEIYSVVSEYNFENETFEELSYFEIEKLKKENTEKYYDKYGNIRFFRLSN